MTPLGTDSLINGFQGSPILGVKHMKDLIVRFADDDSGATAIEYGLLAALIAVVIIASVTAVGTNMSAQFSKIANKIGGSLT